MCARGLRLLRPMRHLEDPCSKITIDDDDRESNKEWAVLISGYDMGCYCARSLDVGISVSFDAEKLEEWSKWSLRLNVFKKGTIVFNWSNIRSQCCFIEYSNFDYIYLDINRHRITIKLTRYNLDYLNGISEWSLNRIWPTVYECT